MYLIWNKINTFYNSLQGPSKVRAPSFLSLTLLSLNLGHIGLFAVPWLACSCLSFWHLMFSWLRTYFLNVLGIAKSSSHLDLLREAFHSYYHPHSSFIPLRYIIFITLSNFWKYHVDIFACSFPSSSLPEGKLLEGRNHCSLVQFCILPSRRLPAYL